MLTKSVLGAVTMYLFLRSYISSFTEPTFSSQDVLEEYDFIIIGSGPSGSVIANRLSEDSSFRVLLVEAGDAGHNDVIIETPFLTDHLDETWRDWQFKTVTQSRLAPTREIPLTQGKVGGGSSAVNYMTYNRGSRHDYNSWKDKGGSGWGYDEITKYFNKVEKDQGENASSFLGKNGKVPITKQSNSAFANLMLKVAEEIGYPYVDHNAGGLAEGFSIPTRTVQNGVRQYAANTYLWPIKERSNLHMSFKTMAHRILFEKENGIPAASAVELEFADGSFKAIKVSKEVIVCAGAISSPQLLMLSGIGPKDHLERFGIDVVKDLPGVGENLQDHVRVPTHFYIKDLPEKSSYEEIFESFPKYILRGEGGMSLPDGPSVIGHLRSRYFGSSKTASSLNYPFPDLQYLFVGRQTTTQQLKKTKKSSIKIYENDMWIADDERSGVLSNLVIFTSLMHPKSRGTVRLRSSNVKKHPVVNPRYLENEDDVAVLIDGLQLLEEFEQSSVFKKHNATMMVDEKCGRSNVKKSQRSNAFYECHIKGFAESSCEPCCTNKMGYRRDRMSVVDKSLRVHGVKNIRIADSSVMPHLTSSNLQSACYMIGEKAADMIKGNWNFYRMLMNS